MQYLYYLYYLQYLQYQNALIFLKYFSSWFNLFLFSKILECKMFIHNWIENSDFFLHKIFSLYFTTTVLTVFNFFLAVSPSPSDDITQQQIFPTPRSLTLSTIHFICLPTILNVHVSRPWTLLAPPVLRAFGDGLDNNSSSGRSTLHSSNIAKMCAFGK